MLTEYTSFYIVVPHQQKPFQYIVLAENDQHGKAALDFLESAVTNEIKRTNTKGN